MTLKEIHDFLLFIIDKEISGWASPGDIDSALDRASLATFKQMQPYYAENEYFKNTLAPFKVSYTFTNTTSVAGVVQLPGDYLSLLSVMVMYYDNIAMSSKFIPVEQVNSDELAERLASQLRPVTVNKPVIHWVGKGKFQLYPQKVSAGQVWYLKRPNKPQYIFTQTGRTVTYDSVNSVQLEWAELELNNILFRALQLLGVNLSDEQMVQYTQLKLQDA